MPFVVKKKTDARPPWYQFMTKAGATDWATYANAEGDSSRCQEKAKKRLWGHYDHSDNYPWAVVWVDNLSPKAVDKDRLRAAAQAVADFFNSPEFLNQKD